MRCSGIKEIVSQFLVSRFFYPDFGTLMNVIQKSLCIKMKLFCFFNDFNISAYFGIAKFLTPKK